MITLVFSEGGVAIIMLFQSPSNRASLMGNSYQGSDEIFLWPIKL